MCSTHGLVRILFFKGFSLTYFSVFPFSGVLALSLVYSCEVSVAILFALILVTLFLVALAASVRFSGLIGHFQLGG